MVKVLYLCGRLATVGPPKTRVTATGTQTASTPCPSAARQNTAPSPGTWRSVVQPSPPPTAVGLTTRGR